MAAGTRCVLAVDHTKLDRVALHRVAPLEKFDVIVVDAQAPAEAVQRLRERRYNVEVAG